MHVCVPQFHPELALKLSKYLVRRHCLAGLVAVNNGSLLINFLHNTVRREAGYSEPVRLQAPFESNPSVDAPAG